MSNLILLNDYFTEIKFKLGIPRNFRKKMSHTCFSCQESAKKGNKKEKIKDRFEKRIPAMKINHSRKLLDM